MVSPELRQPAMSAKHLVQLSLQRKPNRHQGSSGSGLDKTRYQRNAMAQALAAQLGFGWPGDFSYPGAIPRKKARDLAKIGQASGLVNEDLPGNQPVQAATGGNETGTREPNRDLASFSALSILAASLFPSSVNTSCVPVSVLKELESLKGEKKDKDKEKKDSEENESSHKARPGHSPAANDGAEGRFLILGNRGFEAPWPCSRMAMEPELHQTHRAQVRAVARLQFRRKPAGRHQGLGRR